MSTSQSSQTDRSLLVCILSAIGYVRVDAEELTGRQQLRR